MDLETETPVAPLKEVNWANLKEKYFDPEIFSNLLERKPKILWFLDDCDVLTTHKNFLEELEEHVQIDVYGKCGAHQCIDDCDDILNSTYKFHLFMDNSLCMEQVPEKLIDYKYYNTIPIVMGSENLKYYLPPKTYVDIHDFKTVRDLGDHLKNLMQKHLEFINHFWWRIYYKYEENQPFCELCEKLHEPNFDERMQYIGDIAE